MKICTSCNAENSDELKFCKMCAMLLSGPSEEKTSEVIYKDRVAQEREQYLKKEGILGGKLRRTVAQNLDPSEKIFEIFWINGGVLLVLTDKNFWMFQVQSYGGNNIDPLFSSYWDSWTRSENNIAIPLDQLARFDPYPGYFQFLFTVTAEPFDLQRNGWEVKKDKERLERMKKFVNDRGLKPATLKVAVVEEKHEDPKEALLKIKSLLEDGLITESEFETKKAEILKRI